MIDLRRDGYAEEGDSGRSGGRSEGYKPVPALGGGRVKAEARRAVGTGVGVNRFLFNPSEGDPGRANTLLNERPGAYRHEGYRTTLTLKAVAQGRAFVRTTHGRYLIDPENVLVLNQGQTYGVDIGGADGTETLVLFFAPGLVERVAAESRCDVLEEPWADSSSPGSFGVVERLYPRAGRLGERLRALHAGASAGLGAEEWWLEEKFLELAAELVALDGGAREECEAFPGLRASTRVEMYRRLHLARDMIYSCYAGPLRIADLARAAMLSPFHFQRLFKQAFGATPMGMLRERRLCEARRMLAEPGAEVTAVCRAVGFESLGSFSWLYKKRWGTPPSGRERRRG